MKIFISLGNIGRTVRAKINNPNKTVGKYQIKFVEPSMIGEEIISPRIAFLESVKNINAKNIRELKVKILLIL